MTASTATPAGLPTGALLIGADDVPAEGAPFSAINPATGEALVPSFGTASAAQIDRACTLATAAFDTYRATRNEARAVLLDAMAAEIEALGSTLIERAMAESGLPAARLDGQLTATLHLDDASDLSLARALLPVLERKAGRILANGFLTGVEVGHAMVHGGPWPATSDARSTSVGAGAIQRFLRPVCYQDLPQALLPEPLRDGALAQAWRSVDGAMHAPA